MNKEADLNRWFKEKWVDISRKDKSGKHPECGRDDADKGAYPKCRPSKKVSKETPTVSKSLSKRDKKKARESVTNGVVIRVLVYEIKKKLIEDGIIKK